MKEDSDHIKLLFSINMLNEGVHVRSMNDVILFGKRSGPSSTSKQIGRALTTGM